MALGIAGRAPDAAQAELATSAFRVVPGTLEPPPGMTPPHLDSPPALFRVPESGLDRRVGVACTIQCLISPQARRVGVGCQATTSCSALFFPGKNQSLEGAMPWFVGRVPLMGFARHRSTWISFQRLDFSTAIWSRSCEGSFPPSPASSVQVPASSGCGGALPTDLHSRQRQASGHGDVDRSGRHM